MEYCPCSVLKNCSGLSPPFRTFVFGNLNGLHPKLPLLPGRDREVTVRDPRDGTPDVTLSDSPRLLTTCPIYTNPFNSCGEEVSLGPLVREEFVCKTRRGRDKSS